MLRHIDLWREMDRIRKEFDNIFSGYQRVTDSGTYPLLNVYDNRDEVIVTAELPGMTKEKVNITFMDEVLTVSGKLEPLADTQKMTAVRRERSIGAFEKRVHVPFKVQQDKISASFEDGVLTIRMPKSEEARPKTITIE
ncbi:MAG: Hsp20/alpha crystallin family protein [Fibrobacter sp.]|jgi:HSP20 family protein|nr:Hsp20/alpha crystallin family protein [Fibrobacter sp.]